MTITETATVQCAVSVDSTDRMDYGLPRTGTGVFEQPGDLVAEYVAAALEGGGERAQQAMQRIAHDDDAGCIALVRLVAATERTALMFGGSLVQRYRTSVGAQHVIAMGVDGAEHLYGLAASLHIGGLTAARQWAEGLTAQQRLGVLDVLVSYVHGFMFAVGHPDGGVIEQEITKVGLEQSGIADQAVFDEVRTRMGR